MWLIEQVFFPTPRDELSEAFQSWSNIHFLTFSLKNGKNLSSKVKFEDGPEKSF